MKKYFSKPALSLFGRIGQIDYCQILFLSNYLKNESNGAVYVEKFHRILGCRYDC